MFLADDAPVRVSAAAAVNTEARTLLLERSGEVCAADGQVLDDAVYLGDAAGAACYGSSSAGVEWWRHEAVINLTGHELHYRLRELAPADLALALACGPLPRGSR